MSARPSLREALIEMLAVHSAESDAQKGTQDWCERAARAESLAWQALMSNSTKGEYDDNTNRYKP